MRRACLIVGKAPVAGLAKTRLVPPLSNQDAADLYAAFLSDTVALASDLGWERVSVVHPRGDRSTLTDLLPPNVHLLEQPGTDLHDALASAFAHHLAHGFDRVVLIGSDSPTLPRDPVEQACAALEVADLSIGPSLDGGYYLIGMRQPHLPVFKDIDWSTPRAYAQTLDNARRLGLRVHPVQEWYDVDEPRDLQRLQDDLRSQPADVAPNTRAVLERVMSVADGNWHQ
jgi:uncharacterized protein